METLYPVQGNTGFFPRPLHLITLCYVIKSYVMLHPEQIFSRFLEIYKRKSLAERQRLASTFIHNLVYVFTEEEASESLSLILKNGIEKLKADGHCYSELTLNNYCECFLLLLEAYFLSQKHTLKPDSFNLNNIHLN